jgi:hypothetical protein
MLAAIFTSIHEQLFPLPRHFGINTETTLEVAHVQIYFFLPRRKGGIHHAASMSTAVNALFHIRRDFKPAVYFKNSPY